MDAFRLLSRSTTLRDKSKTGLIKQQSQQKVTSQGDAADPRIYGREERLTEQCKKRKREVHARGDISDEDDLGELDFFGDVSASKQKRLRISSEAENGHETHEQQGENAQDTAEKDVDAGECRRILKAHKIKTAQLWPPVVQKETSNTNKKPKRKHKETKEEHLKKKDKRKRAEIPLQPLTDFSQLQTRFGVYRRICDNIVAQGYEMPTEVQMGGLPLLLDKEGPAVDLLSIAPTGSGKTLAFLIPVLNAAKRAKMKGDFKHKRRHVRAVILAPTKELASQIVNEGRKLAKNTGVQVTLLKKGMRVGEEFDMVDGGADPAEVIENYGAEKENESDADEDSDEHATSHPGPEMLVKSDIVVSTPLNMVHALRRLDKSAGRLPSADLLVLDEADVLLDSLFQQQTLEIWKSLSNPNLRVSLWSATMGASIEHMASIHLAERWIALPKDQQKIYHRAPLLRLVVGLKDSAIPNIHHKLVYAATEQGKLMGLRQILRGDAAATAGPVGQGTSSTVAPKLLPPFLVFTQTIARAVALHSELLYDIPVEAGGSSRIAVLHSDLTDKARDQVMTRFRKGEIWVLITTDLLSRGVDFRGVNGVVSYDFPNSAAAYIHRAGRTGRAGREGGVAVTLYAKEDIPYVKNVANVIAAGERQNQGDRTGGDGTARWLLDMLPMVSKRDKQRLKRGGVESRRTGREDASTRISTKSGYERKVENRKMGAVTSSKRRSRADYRTVAAAPVGEADVNFDSSD